MNTIVTHQSPDLDALASVWLVRRFRKGWEDANVVFVSAGRTLHNTEPDEKANVMHVDTGFGMFDHHQNGDYTCAAEKVCAYLTEHGYIKPVDLPAVLRIVEVVKRYDHFREVFLSEADDDMHAFSLAYVIFGLRAQHDNVAQLVKLSEYALNGIMHYMKGKIHAEKIIQKGEVVTTYWGRTLILSTDNDMSMKLAFMKGFDMVVRYSPQYRNMSIKVHPRSKRKLSRLYKIITRQDKEAQWFYHASGRMLLNGSVQETRHMVTSFTIDAMRDLILGFPTAK